MSTHAHDFLDLISTRADGWPSEELESVVSEKFGDAVRFHTCSMSDLTFPDLLEFLSRRGKIAIVNDRLFIGAQVCKH